MLTNKFVMSAAALSVFVAGCSAEDNYDDTAADQTAMQAEATAVTAFDGGAATGTFEATNADGLVVTQTVAEDGSLTNVAGDETSTGTWELGDGGAFCSTMEGEAEATCYTPSDLTEEGTWTATNSGDPSDSWTIRRVEVAAAE